jgi:hypothetical protein
MYIQELNHIHGKSMDNYNENIVPGWNYPEARQVKALGLSSIQTQVLHASCKFGELKLYRKNQYGLVKAIGLQGVECNREQVIEAISELVDLGFIHITTISNVDNKYRVYYVEADFRKIRLKFQSIEDAKFYNKLF